MIKSITMKSTILFAFLLLFLTNFTKCQIASPINCTYTNGMPFHESRFKKVVSINSESVIYCISGDNKVICYDFINGNIVNQIEIHGYIHDMCLFDRALLIAYSNSNEGFVGVLDTSLSIVKNIYNSNELVFKVITNSNYTQAAILDALYNVVVIDLKSSKVKRKFSNRNHSINDIFYSFNSLYYSNNNGSLGILGIENGEDLRLVDDARLTSCIGLEAIGDTIIFGNKKNIYVLTNKLVVDSLFKVPIDLLDMALNPIDSTLCILLENGLVISCGLNERIELQSQESQNILLPDKTLSRYTTKLSIAKLDEVDEHSVSYKGIFSTCVANYGRRKVVLGTTSGDIILCNANLELIERVNYVSSPITQIEINRRGSILYATNASQNLFSLFLPKLSYGEFIVYNTFNIPFKFKDNNNLVGVTRNLNGTDTVYNVNVHKVYRKLAFNRFNVGKDNSIYNSHFRITQIEATKHNIVINEDNRICFIKDTNGEVFCDTVQIVENFACDYKGTIYTLSGVDTLILKVNGESIVAFDYTSRNLTGEIIFKIDNHGRRVGAFVGNELIVVDVKTRKVIWTKAFEQDYVYDFDFIGRNEIVFSHGNIDVHEIFPEAAVREPLYSRTQSGSIVYNAKAKYLFTIMNSGELCSYSLN